MDPFFISVFWFLTGLMLFYFSWFVFGGRILEFLAKFVIAFIIAYLLKGTLASEFLAYLGTALTLVMLYYVPS